jgi:hypothetical protein
MDFSLCTGQVNESEKIIEGIRMRIFSGIHARENIF